MFFCGMGILGVEIGRVFSAARPQSPSKLTVWPPVSPDALGVPLAPPPAGCRDPPESPSDDLFGKRKTATESKVKQT